MSSIWQDCLTIAMYSSNDYCIIDRKRMKTTSLLCGRRRFFHLVPEVLHHQNHLRRKYLPYSWPTTTRYILFSLLDQGVGWWHFFLNTRETLFRSQVGPSMDRFYRTPRLSNLTYALGERRCYIRGLYLSSTEESSSGYIRSKSPQVLLVTYKVVSYSRDTSYRYLH